MQFKVLAEVGTAEVAAVEAEAVLVDSVSLLLNSRFFVAQIP
jgi:hypothetical protein